MRAPYAILDRFVSSDLRSELFEFYGDLREDEVYRRKILSVCTWWSFVPQATPVDCRDRSASTT